MADFVGSFFTIPLAPILLRLSRTAGAAGFLTLIQSRDLVGPGQYLEPSRFDTIPSHPSLEACSKAGHGSIATTPAGD